MGDYNVHDVPSLTSNLVLIQEKMYGKKRGKLLGKCW